MSPALKMGFELLRPWGVISSVGVHNAEVNSKDHLPSPEHWTDALQIPWYLGDLIAYIDKTVVVMADCSIGLAIKHMARICVFRWADVLCDQYFLKL